jgi:hypothetical protein
MLSSLATQAAANYVGVTVTANSISIPTMFAFQANQ